ncbi:MAG: molybdopterin oxidoreductase, partial [bacterium]|nr:molybdopterin oxidoreductase [bacterium]
MIKLKSITTGFYLGLGFLGLMGLAAMAYRLMEGLNVTGLTSYVVWGIWVASYIYLAGLSAGAFVV